MADGVKMGEGKAEIKIRPGAVTVIAPARGAESHPKPKEEVAEIPPPVYPVEEKDVLEKVSS